MHVTEEEGEANKHKGGPAMNQSDSTGHVLPMELLQIRHVAKYCDASSSCSPSFKITVSES